MGAMHNDLNRCNFMYADDRRCRNLIETPGNPFCYYHNRARKKPSINGDKADLRAARAFFDWLAKQSLVSATHLSQAVNVVFLLSVADRISSRRADSLLRLARFLLKSVPDVRLEFDVAHLRKHWRQGERFLKEIQPMLAAVAPDSPPSTDPPPSDPPPIPVAAPVPPLQNSRRTGSQPVLQPLEVEHRATTGSQPVRSSSSLQNQTDSVPSSPPASAASLMEQLHNADPAVHEEALQAIAVRLAEGLSRRVSRIARRAASG